MKLEAGGKRTSGWDSDYAVGASADCCRFFSAASFQSEKAVRKLFNGKF